MNILHYLGHCCKEEVVEHKPFTAEVGSHPETQKVSIHLPMAGCFHLLSQFSVKLVVII